MNPLNKIISYKRFDNRALNKCLNLLDQHATNTNSTEEVNNLIDNILHNSDGNIRLMIQKIKSYAISQGAKQSRSTEQWPKTFKYTPTTKDE